MPVTIDDLKSIEDAEIQRLLACTLSPEDLTTIDTYYRAKWTAATRKAHKANGGYFAGGDGESYPLKDCSDVGDAWGLAGHADNPDQVRSNIKSWASKHECTSSLPDTAKDDSDRVETPVIVRADGSHDPFTGKHSHPHAANGDQGGDETHDHSHSHDGDADHGHSHAESRADMPTTIPYLIAPITRIDKENREVEGVATSEAVDSFGTVFSYEASKKAFQRWMERTANVREMHDKKAVGKGITVRFDDDAKKIYLRTRVSRSADGENSWIKINEGILDGYSVGATNPVWGTIERDGKKYPYLTSYDLAETSLVDNASNPDGQGLMICRADGLTDVVDVSELETPAQTTPAPVVTPEVERAGARISGATASKMHESITHTLQAAKSQMQNCGCPSCLDAIKQLDPDNDDDIDAFGGNYGDTDGDADSLYADKQDDGMEERLNRLLEPVIARMNMAISAMTQRSNAVLARVASTPDYPIITPELIRSAVSAELTTYTTTLQEQLTAVTTTLERLSASSSLPEVRAELSAVKEVVERIAAQPAPGGPVLGGAYPVDKRLANQPYTQQPQQDTRSYWDWAQREGLLVTPEQQMRAAKAAIVATPGRMG